MRVTRSAGLRVAWRIAGSEADRGRSLWIEPCHLLIGLLRFADMDRTALASWAGDGDELVAEAADLRARCVRARIVPKAVRREVRRQAGRPDGPAPPRAAGITHRSQAARDAFASAEGWAGTGATVCARHLLVAVLVEPDDPITSALDRFGLDVDVDLLHTGADPGAAPPTPPTPTPTPILDGLGRDLTALAAAGRLEPVVGRRAEMRELARVLSRQRKANAILVGEAGVGKTGVVEGLAARIVADPPPPGLAGVRLVELTTTALTAGTTYRGQLEERMRDLLAELAGTDRVVVFIDEIHTLVGAGSGSSAMDVATMLKPALARGELRCIGATTAQEYRRWIERDPALNRRFQVVGVDEPDRSAALEILAGVRDRLAAHHGVSIADDALAAAVDLGVRYLPDLRLPDKAIDLLDQACARARLLTLTPAEPGAPGTVGREDVVAVVADRVRAAPENIAQEPDDRLAGLERVLGDRVLGQPDAIRAVATAVRTAWVGLRSPGRPVGAFLFAGPSGTGKTELARALAAALFADERHLIRIDMSEYKERHSVSRLIGAPPGYLGHDRDGQLTAAVRERPSSVVLFDEIEKAHPEVLDLLLQVLDDGRLTDGRGTVAHFGECVIVLTSNLGTSSHRGPRFGFGANGDPGRDHDRDERVRQAVRDGLRPELLGRVGDPVVFRPLDAAALGAIARRLVDGLAGQLVGRGIRLVVSDAAVRRLVASAVRPEHGARELQRLVRDRIADPVARAVVAGRLHDGGTARVDIAGAGGVELVCEP